uniref:Uncharacterized protein n=1 Tax=Oryza glumipatula TaxID=40148 RepID=A0A0D9ZBB9_9ORYZ
MLCSSHVECSRLSSSTFTINLVLGRKHRTLVLLKIRGVTSRGCLRATKEQLDDVHEAMLAGCRRPSSR